MPNQMSPDSRRVSFISDKTAYEALEKIALEKRMSVGELIRRALEDQYDLTPAHPIVQIRVPPKARAPRKATPKKAPGKKNVA